MLSKIRNLPPTWLFGAILLLGLFLRLIFLASESIWMDEWYTLTESQFKFFDLIKNITQESHIPTYFLLMKGWFKIFGTSVFSLRLPSVIFGVLSIWLIYLVGKLMFSKTIGLIAAGILAVSAINIEYSQEGRMYTLAVFSVLLSVYFCQKMLNSDFKQYKLPFVLTTLLAVYIHNYVIFFLIFLFLFLIIKYYKTENFFPLTETLGIILIFYLPWFFITFNQFLNPAGPQHPTFFLADKPISIINIIDNFLIRSRIAAWQEISNLVSFWPNLFLGFLIIMGLINFFKTERKDKEKILFLAGWLVIPITLPWLISKAWKNIYGIHYLLFASPALYLLIAYGTTILKDYFNNRQIKYFLTVTIILGLSFTTLNLGSFYKNFHKPPWREIANFVEEKEGGNDAVIFAGESQQVIEAFWFYLKNKSSLPLYPDGKIDINTAKNKNLWLIYYLKNQYTINPQNIKEITGKNRVLKEIIDKRIVVEYFK